MVAQGHAVADELSSDTELRRAPLAIGEPVAVRRDSQIRRAPSSNGLYDVLDLILDREPVLFALLPAVAAPSPPRVAPVEVADEPRARKVAA